MKQYDIVVVEAGPAGATSASMPIYEDKPNRRVER